MIIRAVHNKQNPYCMLLRDTLQDSRLPARALGILVYLMSKPDDWEPAIEDICRRFKDVGREQAYRIINETLIPLGYARRVCEKQGGRFLRWVTEIYESPVTENQHVDEPDAEIQDVVPDAGFQDVALPDTGYQMLKTSTIDINRVQSTEDKIQTEQETEVSRVKRVSTRQPTTCDETYLVELQQNPAYVMLNVSQCYYRMVAWCSVRGQQPTRRRLLAWLNREDKPMTAPTPSNGGNNGRYQIPRKETLGERNAREYEELLLDSLAASNGHIGPDTENANPQRLSIDVGGR